MLIKPPLCETNQRPSIVNMLYIIKTFDDEKVKAYHDNQAQSHAKPPSAHCTGQTQVTLNTKKHLLDFNIVLVHQLEMLYNCSVNKGTA